MISRDQRKPLQDIAVSGSPVSYPSNHLHSSSDTTDTPGYDSLPGEGKWLGNPWLSFSLPRRAPTAQLYGPHEEICVFPEWVLTEGQTAAAMSSEILLVQSAQGQRNPSMLLGLARGQTAQQREQHFPSHAPGPDLLSRALMPGVPCHLSVTIAWTRRRSGPLWCDSSTSQRA